MTENWAGFDGKHFLPPKRAGRSKAARASIALDWRPANIFDVASRDGWTCAYCGTAVEAKGRWDDDPSRPPATLDHVVPRVRGGGDTNYNAVLACGSCNSIKRDRHPATVVKH